MPADSDRARDVFLSPITGSAFDSTEDLDRAWTLPDLRALVGRPLSARTPAGPPGDTRPYPPRTDVGTTLSGRYKLLELIGEGGTSTVWVAHQTDPVKRAVAVKLIKAGMDSRAVLARFEAERGPWR
ncbi:hypothetical protein [Fimbriiglobus ruber]|uniref:Serine/threonine protein kinase n=1 Tax=Fimbriiglobus ruber TaxID=1908690 RepID=A0A225DGG2_9BACT|nr:hypothetical protein [Fimbriiglobus ruber]OWK37608.1 serine/threonine protein kinase [Fimbriiglobus ruber]